MDSLVAEWVADSVELEIAVQSVPLKRYAALALAAANAPMDSVAQQELICERFRLLWQFGSYPVQVAVNRWTDTFRLSHPGVLERRERANRPVYAIGAELCGIPNSPSADEGGGAPGLRTLTRPRHLRPSWFQ